MAPKVAGALRERGLIEATGWLGLFLLGAAIVVQGLKRRPGGAEIGIALGVAGAYLIAFLRMSVPEERTHLFEYTMVALFIHEALTERASQGRHVPVPALLAILATATVGVLDEIIQSLLPNRVFDPIDILFNTLAGVMTVLAIRALRWARRRAGKDHKD